MLSAVVKPLPSLFRLPPLSSSSLSLYFRVSPSPQSPRLLFSRRSYSRHAFLGDHHLSCSMPNKPLRVAVLLSGGVDSSVALRLLHAAGHSFTPFYLKIWFQEGFENFWNQCPWEDDLKYAKHVCEQVDVPLEVVHLTDEYWERVVSYIIEEYRCGRTPNPDVLCNTRIKVHSWMQSVEWSMSTLLQFIMLKLSILLLIKLIHHLFWNYHKTWYLCLKWRMALHGDEVKDQTYFLSHLCQTQLKRLLFPLGCVKKEEVRKLATEFDLPNKDRKDSQGICFLGKIKFSDFVGRHIGEMKGIILEAETGDFSVTIGGFGFTQLDNAKACVYPVDPGMLLRRTPRTMLCLSQETTTQSTREGGFSVLAL